MLALRSRSQQLCLRKAPRLGRSGEEDPARRNSFEPRYCVSNINGRDQYGLHFLASSRNFSSSRLVSRATHRNGFLELLGVGKATDFALKPRSSFSNSNLISLRRGARSYERTRASSRKLFERIRSHFAAATAARR